MTLIIVLEVSIDHVSSLSALV